MNSKQESIYRMVSNYLQDKVSFECDDRTWYEVADLLIDNPELVSFKSGYSPLMIALSLQKWARMFHDSSDDSIQYLKDEELTNAIYCAHIEWDKPDAIYNQQCRKEYSDVINSLIGHGYSIQSHYWNEKTDQRHVILVKEDANIKAIVSERLLSQAEYEMCVNDLQVKTTSNKHDTNHHQ